jgi:Ni/Co efflux regulator RcnB
MRKMLLGVAAAAMTLTGFAASAQPYGYYGDYRSRGAYDSDRDGRPDYREWNRDRDRDGRPDQYDRYDNRRGYGYRDSYRDGRRWRQGQVYPYYRNRGYVIEDYRYYRLPPPRPGYRYYRSDNGDVVMAAIASGVIGLIIGGALSDNDHRDYRDYRYDRRY